MQQLAVHGATPSRAGNAWQASPFVWTRPFADTMRLPGMAAGSRGPLLPRRAAAPATSAPSRVRPCNARPCVTNAERSRPTRRSGMRARRPFLSLASLTNGADVKTWTRSRASVRANILEEWYVTRHAVSAPETGNLRTASKLLILL